MRNKCDKKCDVIDVCNVIDDLYNIPDTRVCLAMS